MITNDITLYIAASIIFVVVQSIKIYKKRELNILELLVKCGFVNYCIFTITLLFLPLYFDPRAIEIQKLEGWKYNYIPFASLIDMTSFALKHGYYTSLLKNILGNLVLFLPLSFYLKVVWKKLKNVKSAIVFSFIIPVLVELTQVVLNVFLASGRGPDIDDVILNSIGIIAGYLLAVKYGNSFMAALIEDKIYVGKKNFSNDKHG
jgi:glycopeptide antibiotics resistance protein